MLHSITLSIERLTMYTRRLIATALCASFLVSLTADIASANRLPKLNPDQAPGYFFVNFQIVEIKNKVADAYLDVQMLSKEYDISTDLRTYIEAAVVKFDDIIAFFTDKEVEYLNLQIIRITNINEYNIGAGFASAGYARIVKGGGKWRIETFELRRSD